MRQIKYLWNLAIIGFIIVLALIVGDGEEREVE